MLDDLPLPLDRTLPAALSVQIATGLRAAAADGSLRGGDRLPSTRALAGRLGVSRTVVASAYDQLHAEGWLTGRRGSGTYLTTSPTSTPAHIDAATTPEHAAARFDLRPGAPCAEAIDPAAWRRAWRWAATKPPLVYKNRAGEPEFRAAVTEHLLRHRGLGADNASVLLATSGTTAAATELATALFGAGATIAMENPGYQRAAIAFRTAGMRVVPVPVDGDGLRVEELPDSVDAVYCTPAHQFPLGARMPAARRVALVEYARRTGALLIEDDYDGELRYDTAPLPLLAALAPDVVVHLGTTSKILSPSLGVGWLVAAPRIADAVLEHRVRTGTNPAPTGQQVFAAFAAQGDLARHLRRLRRVLPPRRALVVDALRAVGATVIGDDAGSHVTVPLPDAATEQRVVELGNAAAITLDGLSRYHHDTGAPHYGVAIGYTALPWKSLVKAVPIAADCFANGGASVAWST